MKVSRTILADVLLIEPTLFKDNRGVLFESFNAQKFAELTGITASFVQDNISRSRHNVLRGLHYQIANPQGKLVQVVAGEIFDVAVDLRQESTNFGQWVGNKLSATNRHQHWIPPGFAHGFLVTSASADVLYKMTSYYTPETERCILWRDPKIGIAWPIDGEPILSVKDSGAGLYGHAE